MERTISKKLLQFKKDIIIILHSFNNTYLTKYLIRIPRKYIKMYCYIIPYINLLLQLSSLY